MIEKIKVLIGQYILSKERKKAFRQKASLNFNHAKSIGLVFEATHKEEFELIKDFIKWLRNEKKTIKSIGYFDLKKVPPLHYSKLEYDFISKNELNWWNKPTVDFIKTFINEEFDIFINLSIKDVYPLTYISTLSKSKFKISCLSDSYLKDFDLLIDIRQKPKLDFFLKQVKHYLKKINQPQNAKTI